MAVRITGIRLAGGMQHEHITHLGWVDDTGGAGISTRASMVKWIEEGGRAYVQTGVTRVDVVVVTPTYGPKYLRTVADGKYTNNLLSLPRI